MTEKKFSIHINDIAIYDIYLFQVSTAQILFRWQIHNTRTENSKIQLRCNWNSYNYEIQHICTFSETYFPVIGILVNNFSKFAFFCISYNIKRVIENKNTH